MVDLYCVNLVTMGLPFSEFPSQRVPVGRSHGDICVRRSRWKRGLFSLLGVGVEPAGTPYSCRSSAALLAGQRLGSSWACSSCLFFRFSSSRLTCVLHCVMKSAGWSCRTPPRRGGRERPPGSRVSSRLQLSLAGSCLPLPSSPSHPCPFLPAHPVESASSTRHTSNGLP